MRSSDKLIPKVIVGILSTALAAVVVMFGILIFRTWGEYQAFEARETALLARVDAASQERDAKQAYLKRLMSDPDFFERVTRERLGYSREDERIIRFE